MTRALFQTPLVGIFGILPLFRTAISKQSMPVAHMIAYELLAPAGYCYAVGLRSEGVALVTGADDIKQKGRACSQHIADVSQEDQVKGMIDQVVEEHGGLDVMVANAGFSGVPRATFLKWDRVMNINARGTFLCCKYAGIQMIKQARGGRIIGTSSVAGKKAMPRQAVYSPSKFAMRGLTQAAGPPALEFGAYGITVNAYAPGAVDTQMWMYTVVGPNPIEGADILNRLKELAPLKQIGVSDDIANLVSFLASKQSQFITAHAVNSKPKPFWPRPSQQREVKVWERGAEVVEFRGSAWQST
ncbi:hypothetical protein C8R43DRAFT_940968 [Mycena crocata]|nr:hypothetical protein C8R43DRAFT_940968 [Mycena crocata]